MLKRISQFEIRPALHLWIKIMEDSDNGMALAHALNRVARREATEPFSALVVELERIESQFLQQLGDSHWKKMETRRRVAEQMFHMAISNPTAPQGECKRRFTQLCELGFSDSAQRNIYWTIYARYCAPRDEALRLLRQLVSLLEDESIQTNRDLALTRQVIAELSESSNEPT